MKLLHAAALWVALAGSAQAKSWPRQIDPLLPPGFDVLSTASASPGGGREIVIVALARNDEEAKKSTGAPARPLLLFQRQPDGSYRNAGRNDTVVLRADQGLQCDPFEDGGGVIAVKGRYFTVQNGVACGQHWTDYVTFRFDDALGRYVFDNQRSESWSLNSDTRPDAEALVRVGPPNVRRGDPKRPVLFDDWRPR